MPTSHKKIYLDYAASTPVDPLVLRAMNPYFSARFGNPGSLHSFGQEAIAAVDKARETVARSIGAEFREVIFTSSATEANNLAISGAVAAYRAHYISKANGRRLPTGKELADSVSIGQENMHPRIIVSAIEHESVLEVARSLEAYGVEVVYLPVNKQGMVDLEKLKTSLDEHTVLVSIMYANNEIGTIQPIAEIGKIISDFKNEFSAKSNSGLRESLYPLFHTDASQAFQFLDCNVEHLGVDLMTLSSHKIYGPKGVGALYIKHNGASGLGGRKGAGNKKSIVPLEPSLFGGGQEFGLRSGTENVPAIVGFAKAVELADAARARESKRIAGLREALWRGIKKIYPAAEINGGPKGMGPKKDPVQKAGIVASAKFADEPNILPNILNVHFPAQATQDLLTKFDLEGLAVSSGSACRSRAFESSYVIEALGHDHQRAKSSIRFSLGRPTTAKEIAATLAIIKAATLL